MPDLYVNPRFTIPERELSTSAARSSGPGGQNVNKVNSKITLRWSPRDSESFPPAWRDRFLARYASRLTRDGDLVLQSDRYRDQNRNLADVRLRLAEMLCETATPPKRRKPTRPTLGSKKRRLDKKRQTSLKKRSRRGKWD